MAEKPPTFTMIGYMVFAYAWLFTSIGIITGYITPPDWNRAIAAGTLLILAGLFRICYKMEEYDNR